MKCLNVFLFASMISSFTLADQVENVVPTPGMYGSDWSHCAKMLIPSANGNIVYTLQVGAPYGVGPAFYNCPPNVPERYVRVSTRVFKREPGNGQIIVLSRDRVDYNGNQDRLILPMQDCAAPATGAIGNGNAQPRPTFCPKD
ncbi:MAG: hypothetical protein AB7F59_05615 [Bdellovibrionales bacterium]